MEEVVDNLASESKKKRPAVLTILCVLSFIFSGIMGVFLITVILFLGSSVVNENALPFMLTALGLWALGLISIIFMWRQRRLGFYLYVISNIIVSTLQIVSTGEIRYMTIAIPAIFIVAFATQLKSMK